MVQQQGKKGGPPRYKEGTEVVRFDREGGTGELKYNT